jgi:hypothetical protein
MNKFAQSVALVAMVTLFLSGQAEPAQATVDSCSDRFPEATWDIIRTGPVSIETTGIAPGLAERFREEIALVDGWITEDMGPYSATVCLVSEESSFNTARYESASRRFHAHSDLPSRLFVLNVERVGFVAPAAAYALSQHALWQQNGNEAFPVPIAEVVGQWYRARVLERLEQYHRDVMYGNFFDTDAIVDWTSSTQQPVQNWDPETNFASIGDFMEFAVATYGTDVLLETDGDRWSQIEGEWRVALRNDLRGRDTGTTGWIGGLAFTVTSVLVALIAIMLGLWAKHRKKARPETPAPIPGFFSHS